MSVETTWQDIVAAQPFHTIRGRRFTYQVQGDNIVVQSDTISKPIVIPRRDLEKMIARLPQLTGPGQLKNEIRGSSYLWAILHDKRIRHD